MQNRHGLTLQLSYTYGHEIDIQSGDLGSTNQQGSGGLLSNPFDTRYDRGSGVIDRRHVFNANYIYNFASFEDRGTAMRLLLGGWTFSGVTVATSGNPVNVTYSPDTLGLGGGTTNRPNFDRSLRSYPKKQLAWFNTGGLFISDRSMGWRPQPGLRHCRQGLDCGSWSLQLEPEPVQRVSDNLGRGPANPASRRVVQHLQSHAMECHQHRVHEQQLRTSDLDE